MDELGKSTSTAGKHSLRFTIIHYDFPVHAYTSHVVICLQLSLV